MSLFTLRFIDTDGGIVNGKVESIKTTSMETLSIGVLNKKCIIQEVKIKPKNDMMYQDLCQNKRMKIYYPVCQTY